MDNWKGGETREILYKEVFSDPSQDHVTVKGLHCVAAEYDEVKATVVVGSGKTTKPKKNA
jgi:hypothetical protein